MDFYDSYTSNVYAHKKFYIIYKLDSPWKQKYAAWPGVHFVGSYTDKFSNIPVNLTFSWTSVRH